MEQKVQLYYYNEKLQVGMKDIRHVYLLTPGPKALVPEVYRGKLVYRVKGSNKRISYDQIKKGLVKKAIWIVANTPF